MIRLEDNDGSYCLVGYIQNFLALLLANSGMTSSKLISIRVSDSMLRSARFDTLVLAHGMPQVCLDEL